MEAASEDTDMLGEAEVQKRQEEYYRNIDNVYDMLEVEAISMEFGYSLIPLADEKNGGRMINRVVIFRRQYAQEMGFVIPSIKLLDNSGLGTNQYVIKIRGEEAARGELLVDYYLALEPSNPTGEIEGIEAIEPAYGIPIGGNIWVYGNRPIVSHDNTSDGNDKEKYTPVAGQA